MLLLRERWKYFKEMAVGKFNRDIAKEMKISEKNC